ncbi:RGS domain-containing protein [Mycotypha africana]|uniref:RGS domain-containing protein n=1 Tax=Mycotypha africana TaxID=64632 RepID=UPI0023015AB5|nr:RGS domain-containing protein [Mycotypha africana]KAI8987608.1 RGS domain-containing protein [Mycotypha africana]
MPSSPTATLSEKLETFNFNYKHKNHSSSSSNTIENSGSSNRSNATDSRSTRSSSSKSSSESVTENFIINPLAIQAINSLNGHSSSTVHKNKSTRSAKKLDQFFVKHQQSTKEILCLEEIKKRGLKAILESKAPLCYFLYHSLEEYNSENLFFYLELRQYELFTYSSLGQQTATAKHIFDTYLTNNSFLEVNLDDDIRVTIFKLIEKRQPTLCFDTAKGAIFNLLESSYMRFQNTETFQEMLHYCCCGKISS